MDPRAVLTNAPPVMPLSRLDKPQYGPHTVDSIRDFFRVIIWETFPECCLMKAMKKNGQLPFVVGQQDEMTLNFEYIFRVRGYQAAFIFSLALYFDIRYILEDRVRDPYDQLQSTGALTKARLEEAMARLKGGLSNARLRQECYARIMELHHCVTNDFTEEDRTRRFTEKSFDEPFEKHFHLKRNPVWSGLFDFRCRLVLNDLGFRYICESPMVMAGAFVYYVARIERGETLRWPMMDRFLRSQGEDRVFQGTASGEKTAMSLLKRFVECELCTTAAGDLVGFSRRPISLEAFNDRYGFDYGKARRSMSYLREIIGEKFDVQAGNIFSRQAAVAMAEKEKNTAASGRPAVQNRKEALQSSRVSPVELLEILDETVTSLSENQLTVEYFQLHDESIQLFRDLLEEFSSEADADPNFSFEEGSRVTKLAQLLPVIYRSASTGSPTETVGRLENVTREFCVQLPEESTRLFPDIRD